jgi:hypothetical protein
MPALSDAVSPVAVRHESGLSVSLVGVADTREFDSITTGRINARAVAVSTQLDNAAGSYSWPFTEATQTILWPLRTPEERGRAVSDQWSLAADSVRAYVLGDLFLRAGQRDPMYIEKAKVYYAMAKDMLDAAKASIAAAINNDTAGSGEDGNGGNGPLKLLRIVLPGGPGNHRGYRDNEYGNPYSC